MQKLSKYLPQITQTILAVLLWDLAITDSGTILLLCAITATVACVAGWWWAFRDEHEANP